MIEYFFKIVCKINIFFMILPFSLCMIFLSIFILYFLSIHNCIDKITFGELRNDTCSTVSVTVIFSETVTVVFFFL